MKQDIHTKEDIILLVNTFYESVHNDTILGPIFNDVANIHWEDHLPKMYSFWASVLLQEQSYVGNPMEKHLTLSKITSITETEFSAWLLLFKKKIDDLFEGEKAEEAKAKAENISKLMLHKIKNL